MEKGLVELGDLVLRDEMKRDFVGIDLEVGKEKDEGGFKRGQGDGEVFLPILAIN